MLVEQRAGKEDATFAAALVAAPARDEAAGRRGLRLTEPGLAAWQRFRGRLGSADQLRLAAEDGAVQHPLPFAGAQVGVLLDDVDDALVDGLVDGAVSKYLRAPGPEHVESQAQLLGLPTTLARAAVLRVEPHQKVLEVPGIGGQLCHHLTADGLEGGTVAHEPRGRGPRRLDG
jgi:hypothetical protein